MMAQLNYIQGICIIALPILFGVTVHEAMHGYVAHRLGDKTARMLGRLTLNPLKHIDPIGTVIFPLLTYTLGGFIFGWAKPVPITPKNLKHPKKDMMWIALAGPGANFLMAILWGFIGRLGIALAPLVGYSAVAIIDMGEFGIKINLILMLLNLLPIPPLDGSRVVARFLSNKHEAKYYRAERYGFIILIALIVTHVLQYILQYPFSMLYHSVYTLTHFF